MDSNNVDKIAKVFVWGKNDNKLEEIKLNILKVINFKKGIEMNEFVNAVKKPKNDHLLTEQTKTKTIVSSFNCEICNLEFKTRSGIWKHTKKCHQPGTNKNKCKYCKKELSNRHSRWRHETQNCVKNPKNKNI